jgi:hypothetical protein
MMNRFAYQQNAFGDSISLSDALVCPKPRRLCLFNPSFEFEDQIRPSLRLSNRQAEVLDSRTGNELLDLILNKGNQGTEKHYSHPFFSGSPPSRASNPVIQDARFGSEKITAEAPSGAASGSRKQGGCVRSSNFGPAVRIEGFNCRGNNCGISAVA